MKSVRYEVEYKTDGAKHWYRMVGERFFSVSGANEFIERHRDEWLKREPEQKPSEYRVVRVTTEVMKKI